MPSLLPLSSSFYHIIGFILHPLPKTVWHWIGFWHKKIEDKVYRVRKDKKTHIKIGHMIPVFGDTI